jgi:hypothetical protein
MKVVVARRETPGVCVYCRGIPAAPEVCPGCAARYHPECRDELGRCATIACRAPSSRVRPAHQAAPAWARAGLPPARREGPYALRGPGAARPRSGAARRVSPEEVAVWILLASLALWGAIVLLLAGLQISGV